MFNIGQKVVLVDDKWPDSVLELYAQLPSLNTVYVIRETRVGVEADALIMDRQRKLTQSLLLCGIFNACNKLGVEAGFNSARFRLLEEMQKENAERGARSAELKCGTGTAKPEIFEGQNGKIAALKLGLTPWGYFQ